MELIDKQTQDFILSHRTDDVRKLAFAADKHPDIDFPLALDQIQGWQTARHKLPSWASADGIVYPPHLNMEQCSSEFTAKYKSGLLHNADLLIDLTGGFGVDFSFMSRKAKHAIYVERNPHLCSIAKHNFSLLGLNNVEIVNSDSTEYLKKFIQEPTNTHKSNLISPPLEAQGDAMDASGKVLLFLDPARRDSYGRKMASISDCEPNVISLLPDLAKIASMLVLKLSPMLDWHEAVREINTAGTGFSVSEVHIVSVKNECKELLIVAKNNLFYNRKPQEDSVKPTSPTLYCVNDEQIFVCPPGDSSATHIQNDYVLSVGKSETEHSPSVLLVPNSSIMKAGCFDAVASRYGVSPIGRDSHLFVSSHQVADFPGREFQIIAVSSMNKHELRHNMSGITQANIAVRNFPMKAEALRKRLKVMDGGDVYIFATTVSDGSHVLIITKKIV